MDTVNCINPDYQNYRKRHLHMYPKKEAVLVELTSTKKVEKYQCH